MVLNLKRNAWSNQFKRQHHFRWQRIHQRGWGLGSQHFWGWDRATPQTMEEQIPSEVPGASGPNSPASPLLPTPFCSRQWGGACTNEVCGGPPHPASSSFSMHTLQLGWYWQVGVWNPDNQVSHLLLGREIRICLKFWVIPRFHEGGSLYILCYTHTHTHTHTHPQLATPTMQGTLSVCRALCWALKEVHTNKMLTPGICWASVM